MKSRAFVASGLVLTLIGGCAHDVSPKLRLSRALLGTGAVVTVAGGLAAAGCVHDTTDGCSGGPGDADLAAGIPILAVGAGLILGGLLVRPKGVRAFKGTRPPPPPVQPDPF